MEKTIKIVPDNMYDHSEMTPPKITPTFFRNLLQLYYRNTIYLHQRTDISTERWLHNGIMTGINLDRLLHVPLGEQNLRNTTIFKTINLFHICT